MDTKILSNTNYEFELHIIAHEIFKKEWEKKKEELDVLELSSIKLAFFKKESQDMLNIWLKNFFKKLAKEVKDKTFRESFEKLRPETEIYLESKTYNVRGYVDAVHKIEGEIILMDYKTSSKDKMTDEYRLQLGIYSLLYFDKFGILPNKVGLDLLRHGERIIDVDDELIELAKRETLAMADRTISEEKEDYPIQKTRLCPWCNFKDVCKNNN